MKEKQKRESNGSRQLPGNLLFNFLQLGKESVMEGLPELFWRQGLAARPTQFSPQFYYLSSPLTLRPWQARFHPSIPLTSMGR